MQIRKNMCVLEEINNFLFLWKGIEVIFQKMTSYTPWMYIKFPEKKTQTVDFWVIDRLAASKILFWKYFEDVPLI